VHVPHFESYRHFAYNADERRFLDAADVANYARSYFDDAGALPVNLTGARVVGTRSYPSFDNIKAVFGRLGIDDLRGFLNKKLSFNSQLYMQSLSDTRASVTHKFAPGITLSDVKSYAGKIARLVVWLDHALNKGVGLGTRSAIWSALC